MTYEELLARAKRAICASPELDFTLAECVMALNQFPLGLNRAVAAEKLAHEMAEWIEQGKMFVKPKVH